MLEIKKSMIISIFSFVENNHNNPSVAVPRFEFVWNTRTKYVDSKKIIGLFKKLINHQATNDNIFSKWKKIILSYSPKIEKKQPGFLREFCIELMELVENISIQPTISEDRRKEYASILIELLKISSDSSLKLEIGQKLMVLLLNSNPNLQNLAIEKLPMTINILENKDFRIYLSSIVKQLCEKPVNDIPNFKNPILATIEFQENWDSGALTLFSDLILKSITHQNPNIQDMAHSFLQKATKLSTDKKEDITKAMINLCRTNDAKRQMWELILLKKDKLFRKALINEYVKRSKDTNK